MRFPNNTSKGLLLSLKVTIVVFSQTSCWHLFQKSVLSFIYLCTFLIDHFKSRFTRQLNFLEGHFWGSYNRSYLMSEGSMTNINSLLCVATVCFIISDLFSRGRIGNRTLACVFSCKFGHLFRTPFPKNTSGRGCYIVLVILSEDF